MSIQKTCICDGCGAILGGGTTAAAARKDAREGPGAVTGLPGGQDLCRDCRTGRRAPASWETRAEE